MLFRFAGDTTGTQVGAVAGVGIGAAVGSLVGLPVLGSLLGPIGGMVGSLFNKRAPYADQADGFARDLASNDSTAFQRLIGQIGLVQADRGDTRGDKLAALNEVLTAYIAVMAQNVATQTGHSVAAAKSEVTALATKMTNAVVAAKNSGHPHPEQAGYAVYQQYQQDAMTAVAQARSAVNNVVTNLFGGDEGTAPAGGAAPSFFQQTIDLSAYGIGAVPTWALAAGAFAVVYVLTMPPARAAAPLGRYKRRR
jgi:hypothetical protein